MEFTTWEQAARAAARFEMEYGGGGYRYVIERVGYRGRLAVAVYSDRGTFLSYV